MWAGRRDGYMIVVCMESYACIESIFLYPRAKCLVRLNLGLHEPYLNVDSAVGSFKGPGRMTTMIFLCRWAQFIIDDLPVVLEAADPQHIKIESCAPRSIGKDPQPCRRRRLR